MTNEAEDTLRRFVEILERTGVPYMLTGSFASGYYGQGRASQDIDFVIMPTRDQLNALLDQLTPPDFHVSRETALEALQDRAQFNAIYEETMLKADFMIQKQRPFSAEEFRRRIPAVVADVPVVIATAEDIILSKLEWAKLGSSDRQIEDAKWILRIRSDRLDRAYIENWVRELGLEQQWDAALRAADLPGGLP